MEEFNINRLKLFPNQNGELRFHTCVGETVAFLIGNYYGIPMDAGFSEAAGFAVNGKTPTTAGEDPWDGFLGGVAYGALPIQEADFTAETMGELYENNFNNYSAVDRSSALNYAMNGAYKVKLDFDTVIQAIKDNKGVAMAMKWQGIANTDGVLLPISPTANYFLHCTAGCGHQIVNGEPCIVINAWTGGEFLVNRASFTNILGVYAFNQSSSRWVSLLGIAVTRFPYLSTYLPNLLNKPVAGFPPKIYDVAKSCMGTHITLDNSVPKEYGCAQAVSYVLKKAGFNIPSKGYSSTIDLYNYLLLNKQFVKTTNPKTGDIVISKTVGDNHGHVGTVMLYGICSNHSATGIFEENYSSIDAWETSFKDRGLGTEFFTLS